MKNIYKVLLTVILLSNSLITLGQNRVVNGTITDAVGPVPGITVAEKDVPTNLTITGADGKFKITIRNNSNALIVSGVGFVTQEVSVNAGGTQDIAIRLEIDTKTLEEIVVIGYGSQKKLNVTGSVSSVNRDEIQQTPSASIQNALTGKVSGYFSQQRSGRPGDDAADFFVRGVSTFTGNQSPLILVDDVESSYDNFSNIDPNEVQSISVLKDAAMTATYGVKGANGVILVTTRRGGISPPNINFRTEFGLQVPMHIPQFLDAATNATLRNEALKNEAVSLGIPYVPQFTDADIELYRNGADPYGHPNVNWYKTLFKKTAPTAKTGLDISGGTENVRYFVGLAYQTQGGILREFHKEHDIDNNFIFDRYNFRSNLDIKANKLLSFKLDFSGNNTLTNSPLLGGITGSGPTAAFAEVYNYESLNPYMYSIYNPDGSYGYSDPNHLQPRGSANNIIGRAALGGYSRARSNQLSLNLSALQKLDMITKGLQVTAAVSISNSTSSTKTINRSTFPSFFYNPVTGTYTPRDANIYRIEPYSLSYSAGSPSKQTNLQANLDYVRSFKKHNVTALMLFKQNTGLSGASLPENFRGLTTRVNYNFANKYNVSFAGAYNGTDKFAARKRYGLFPSGSAGWVVTEENFMRKHVKFMNLLKFRGSYGIVGSDNLAGFDNSYQENFARSGSHSFGETHTNVSTIVPGTIGNDNVSWEKQRDVNLGVDFALIKGKISGAVDVFDKRRYDILAQRQTIAPYFGVPDGSLPPENLGIVTNKGYEVELRYKSKIGKDFLFDFRGSYSFAKNKIVEIDEVTQLYPWQTQTGRSIGQVKEYIWDGYYTVAEAADKTVPKYTGSTTAAGGPGTSAPGFLKYRDVNGDGVVDPKDQGYFGKPNLPNTNIGLTSGFTYKRVTLNVLLQSALNSEVQIGYIQVTPWTGNLRAFHLKRWTPETAETAEFPVLFSNFLGTYMNGGQNSTFWAVSGNYLRIKSVELAYSIPNQFISKVGLKGLRVYFNAYNLHTWSNTYNRFGLDPESARGGSGDYTVPYPQSAIFNVGLNVSLK